MERVDHGLNFRGTLWLYYMLLVVGGLEYKLIDGNAITKYEGLAIIRGTLVVLHLKAVQLEHLDENSIQDLVKRSKFIQNPVSLLVEKEVERVVEDDSVGEVDTTE